MDFALTVAVRHLRARRRTFVSVIGVIAIVGIALGVWALSAVLAITSGFQDAFRDKVLGVNAHVLVLKYGWDFTEYREVMATVRATPGVTGAAPFLINPMMITRGERIAGVLVKGVDPDHLGEVLDLPTYLQSGSIRGLRPAGSTAPTSGRDEPSGARDVTLDDYITRAGNELAGIRPTRAQVPHEPAPRQEEPPAVAESSPEPPLAPARTDLLPSGETPQYALPPDAPAGADPLDALARDVARESSRSDANSAQALPGVIVGKTLARTLALHVGDLVRVRPGERIPADAEVVEGITAVDQSALTGESLPVEKATGDTLFAGTVNGGGTVLARVSRLATDSTLARVVRLVEEAQSSKAPSQQLVDRFAAIYTPAVVFGAIALAAIGSLATGDSSTWVHRSLVLLVIACPCALVISTPVAIVSAIGAATRQGVLVKGGAALERIGTAAVVAFDKTGTLTRGRPVVADVIGLNGVQAPGLLGVAAAIEHHSEHPIGRAIVAKALHDDVAIPDNTDFEALVGRGARANVGGTAVMVGSERLLTETGIERDSETRTLTDRLSATGHSVQYVLRQTGGDWTLIGLISVADQMRAVTPAALKALREAGVRQIAMITGDNAAVAHAIGQAAGVGEIHAGLLPADKAAVVTDLQQRYGPVVMVGDGINDAPALATADVGVAMGAAGTDVALESADLALMRDDLGGLAHAIRLSRRTLSIIRQNVTLSLVIKLAALLLGVFGFVSLWIAVLADVGTSLVVTLNGLRLARQPRGAVETVPDAASEPVHIHEHGHDHADHEHTDHDHEHDHAGHEHDHAGHAHDHVHVDHVHDHEHADHEHGRVVEPAAAD